MPSSITYDTVTLIRVVWCTDSGALPQEIPESDDGLIEELVRIITYNIFAF